MGNISNDSKRKKIDASIPIEWRRRTCNSLFKAVRCKTKLANSS